MARHEVIKERMKNRHKPGDKSCNNFKTSRMLLLYMDYGKSTTEVGNMIAGYVSSTAKVTALKAHLNFRKHVIQQPASADTPDAFNFSKKDGERRRQLIWEEVKDNLNTLVEEAATLPVDGSASILVGKNVRHRFIEATENDDLTDTTRETWYFAKVISQV